ncbi:hypothetical protein ZEAMMB73_Zm00001d020268 [Zea mays]|uniref:Uncharacterized protein n=1 Tax=Zea mays TaxID=4577 RepID=A0A1D6I3A1_MAIZE|nr:hypothetical protein ZEAMMB73_Zm00001d020268 [Zea mays]
MEEVRRAGRRCGWAGRGSTGRAWRRSCCPSTPGRRAARRWCGAGGRPGKIGNAPLAPVAVGSRPSSNRCLIDDR